MDTERLSNDGGARASGSTKLKMSRSCKTHTCTCAPLRLSFAWHLLLLLFLLLPGNCVDYSAREGSGIPNLTVAPPPPPGAPPQPQPAPSPSPQSPPLYFFGLCVATHLPVRIWDHAANPRTDHHGILQYMALMFPTAESLLDSSFN